MTTNQIHKPKKPLRIYTQPPQHPGQRRRRSQNHECENTRTTNQEKPTFPTGGRKQCRPVSSSSSECQVASISVSDNELDAPPQTIEVQISSAVTDNKSEKTPQEEDDTMDKAKRGRSPSPETKKREQDKERIERQGKA